MGKARPSRRALRASPIRASSGRAALSRTLMTQGVCSVIKAACPSGEKRRFRIRTAFSSFFSLPGSVSRLLMPK